MEHAITVKDVAIVVGIIGGCVAIGAVLLFLIWLFNPFRTGH
jgi:hypothetical protein